MWSQLQGDDQHCQSTDYIKRLPHLLLQQVLQLHHRLLLLPAACSTST
jgi:hypothetical protein